MAIHEAFRNDDFLEVLDEKGGFTLTVPTVPTVPPGYAARWMEPAEQQSDR